MGTRTRLTGSIRVHLIVLFLFRNRKTTLNGNTRVLFRLLLKRASTVINSNRNANINVHLRTSKRVVPTSAHRHTIRELVVRLVRNVANIKGRLPRGGLLVNMGKISRRIRRPLKLHFGLFIYRNGGLSFLGLTLMGLRYWCAVPRFFGGHGERV